MVFVYRVVPVDRMLWMGPLLALLFLLAPSPAALAAPPQPRSESDEARKKAAPLFEQGNRLLEQKEYGPALEAFQKAYAIYPSSRVLFAMALTYEEMGRLPDAAGAYEEFLARADQDPDRTQLAEGRLKELRAALASVTLSCTVPGATVTLDGEPAGQTPLPHRLYLAPGDHRLVIRHPAHRPWEQGLTLAAGDHREVVATLAAAALPEPAAPMTPPSSSLSSSLSSSSSGSASARPSEGRPIYKAWWFWTAIGAVVVAGAVTTGVLVSQSGKPEAPELGTLTF